MILRDANENCKNEAVDMDIFNYPLTADDDLMNMRGEITTCGVDSSGILDHLLINDIVNKG